MESMRNQSENVIQLNTIQIIKYEPSARNKKLRTSDLNVNEAGYVTDYNFHVKVEFVWYNACHAYSSVKTNNKTRND